MADTYLPPGFKKCKSCQQVKPFEQFGKELKGKFGLKSKCRACISEKNKTYAAGPGAEVKTQNNRTYQAENKTELAEKMRVKRAGNDSNLLIVFYVQIMPDDFVMQLHRF